MLPPMFIFFLDERNMEGSTIAPNISRKERIDLRLLEGYKKEFRPYVLNPKYSCPTSLPLYFYFGYQLLQETEQMKECGPVRNYFFINNIKTIQSWIMIIWFQNGITIYKGTLRKIFNWKCDEKQGSRDRSVGIQFLY